jgi:hypothetical protein
MNSKKVMKVFFDTEFYEDGKTIDLMSIALIREDGHSLYLINTECDWRKPYAEKWHQSNTLPVLVVPEAQFLNREQIKHNVMLFCGVHPGHLSWPRLDKHVFIPEFWGYYADYDWVALCQLFGRMIDLPEGWPKYCRDLKQLMDENPQYTRTENKNAHNALEDAKWTISEYYRLQEHLRAQM